MLLRSFFPTCLLLTNVLIQLTTCALPSNIQNLELDDVTSLWDKFPAIIDKIKEAVSRFRCPKGWKRLGGSCFYLTNFTSTSTDANYACTLLHSNLSDLMRVRNTVELFYAAHVLTRNNLSSLMISIDSSLLQGGKISEMLLNDRGRWARMKGDFREIRDRYQRLKEKIVNRLSSTGLRILRRSKKMKEIPPKQRIHPNEVDSHHYDEYDHDDRELSITPNVRSVDDEDEYEYDDLDSPDESDPFEQIDDIRGICQQVVWDVQTIDPNSTVYVLSTYVVADQTVCSLSEMETAMEYRYLCEYVLDFCFANVICGKHGRCVNTLAGFQCSCSFLYGGLVCDKISEHGRQIVISIIIIGILVILTLKPVRWFLWFLTRILILSCKQLCEKRAQKKKTTNANDDREKLVDTDKSGTTKRLNKENQSGQRRPTLAQEFIEFLRGIYRCITVPKTSTLLSTPNKRNLVRKIWVGLLYIFFSSILFISTSLMYWTSFGYEMNDAHDEIFSINDTIRLVNQCVRISDYRTGNIIFAPFALSLILIFSWSLKREKYCRKMCDGRPALIPPIEPFRTANRFTTATVFGILAFEVLKIFEGLLFSTGQPLEQGVLMELLERIALIILVGLRYYPVLASLQLRNLIARAFTCLYMICDMMYTIVREGSCMGFLPLSGQHTGVEEAKLRKELGSWFIIYGLIKNIPHFFLLSYISAELCVRFIYDSIYVPYRKSRSIWSAPVAQPDESEFARFYVTKLFRRNRPLDRAFPSPNVTTDPDKVFDYEHEAELQNTINQSRVKKFFDSIYRSDDDFRYTTIATCTYTVAIVFLYYLACTLVFLYLSRTTGHILFLKFYVESTFNVELGAFSLKLEIIISAVVTVIIYGCQLFLGMQKYKEHKFQLYRGIYIDVPSAENFKPSSMASNSVHYSGFLVGYMAWGFVICFHLILFMLIAIRLVSLQIRHIELVLAIVVPVLVIYLLKMLSLRSAGKFLFIQKLDDKLNLKSRKTYALFVYFSFFADCFLGIASCIIRLIKATFLNIVFMARLDWSFFGRPLEQFDLGFAAYTSYLHMEVTYTNPVMLAFCYSLFDDIVQRRPRQCYDDECCIAPGELDEDDIEPRRRNLTQPNSVSVQYRVKKHDDTRDGEPLLGAIARNEGTQRPADLRAAEVTLDLPTTRAKRTQKHAGPKGHQPTTTTTSEKTVSAVANAQTIPQPRTAFDRPPNIPRRADLSSERDESETDDQQRSKVNVDNTSDEDDASERKLLAVGKKTQRNSSKRNNDHHAVSTRPKLDKTKKPLVNKQRIREESSPDGSDNNSAEQSRAKRENTSSSSYDTIGELVPNISDATGSAKLRKAASDPRSKVTSAVDRHTVQKTVSCCPPPYSLATDPKDLYQLRTTSYREAHHSTPPLVPYRQSKCSPLHNHGTADNLRHSHYSEIPSRAAQSTANSDSCTQIRSKKASSGHSHQQRSVGGQNRQEPGDIETEEDDDQQEEIQLPQSEENFQPRQSAETLINGTSIDSDKKIEIEKMKRRKQLRFRWHFLYTIIRNYHLFDLRKDVQGRLTRLHLQRSSLVVEQQQLPTSTIVTQPEVVTFADEAAERVTRAQESDRIPVPDTPATDERRPPPPRRLLSVAVSVPVEYPPSPVERYIAIRAQMLYDASTQQETTPYTSTSSQTPTTATSLHPQRPAPTTTFASDRSLGFHTTPDIIVQPPSDASSSSRDRRTTGQPTSRAAHHEPFTPLVFLPGVSSNQSTADYPLATTSITNSSTLRTQMSHEQHMQAWRQDQMGKIQKKQRYCYRYGPPPQTPLVDKVSTAAILTPQILTTATKQQQAPPTSDNGDTKRQPTTSPFQFPPPARSAPSSIASDARLITHGKRSKAKPRQQAIPIPPPRMDRLDEDPREVSNTLKPSTTTSAIVHHDESDSDASDIKKV